MVPCDDVTGEEPKREACDKEGNEEGDETIHWEVADLVVVHLQSLSAPLFSSLMNSLINSMRILLSVAVGVFPMVAVNGCLPYLASQAISR